MALPEAGDPRQGVCSCRWRPPSPPGTCSGAPWPGGGLSPQPRDLTAVFTWSQSRLLSRTRVQLIVTLKLTYGKKLG